jgi:hypothetical protein
VSVRWLVVVLLWSGAANAETKRLAIVVGNNAGAGDLAPLRYAESDAGKMARVLVELGEVSADDVMLLQGRKADEVERALLEAKERITFFKRIPDVRTVLVFFFSGHSDGEAIEMSGEKLPYGRMKALLQGTGADVRVAIIDACRSGAGLREKGGKPAEPFSIRLTDTLQATGEAFITSSAANEAALESNEVMGSFFTHNLISGLRGAADSSGDKLVTLGEAYRYAYDRTVATTAMLAVGAQHPNYDFKLAGQGELVLSTLLKPSALLVLPEADRSLVTDLARDQVVVEVPAGPAREVALPPGQYGVRVFKGAQGFGGRVFLVEGSRRVVALEQLAPMASSVVVARKGATEVSSQVGPVTPTAGDAALSVGFGATGRVLADSASAGAKYQLRLSWEPVTHHLARLGPVALVGQPRLMGLGEMSFERAPPGGGEAPNEAGMQLRVGYQLALEVWRLSFAVGLELGPGFLSQLYGNRASALVLTGAPRAMLRARLASAVWVFVEGDFTFLGAEISLEAAKSGWEWFGFFSGSAGIALSF